jgi:thiamine biosynthesis protein ThiS
MIILDQKPVPYRAGENLKEFLAHNNIDTSVRSLTIVNGKLVQKNDFDSFILSDGDEVRIAPIIGGG